MNKNEGFEVNYGDITVGNLVYSENNSVSFSYDEKWIKSEKSFPLSFSLPLNDSVFDGDVVESYFRGLLPEGKVLFLISQKEHISEENTFGMLGLIGGECAGAISVDASKAEVKFGDNQSDVEITIKDLDLMIDKMDKQPLLTSNHGLRMSLAGVQQKMAVRLDGDVAYIPTNNKASTHIIKPEPEILKSSALNEYACMKIARNMGLKVPNVDIVKGEKHISLMIQRYDRITSNDGFTRKIHQIDLNQSCNHLPYLKYESEGGAGFKDCFDLIKKYSICDADKIVEWAAFNFLISNNDAHSKNISFLLRCKERYDIAPFYDMLCTAAYDGLSDHMSMSIGGEFVPENVSLNNWESLFNDAGIEYKDGVNILENVKEKFDNVYQSTLSKISNDSSIVDIDILDNLQDKFDYKSSLFELSLLNRSFSSKFSS